MSGIELSSAGTTHRGQIRRVNEDDFLIDNNLAVYAVADGLGGHGSGNVASSLAIEVLQEELQRELLSLKSKNSTDVDQLSLVINQAIATVNKAIYAKNKEKGHSDGTGMGTTLVGICFFDNNEQFISFNIGDSRLYRSNNGTLEQSTKDHSLLQEWHDMGQPGDAPAANLLKKAVGLFPQVKADLATHATNPNELLLLCSDGLTAMINDSAIGDSIDAISSNDLQSMCDSLVNSANTSGGQDNITVVVIKPEGQLDK